MYLIWESYVQHLLQIRILLIFSHFTAVILFFFKRVYALFQFKALLFWTSEGLLFYSIESVSTIQPVSSKELIFIGTLKILTIHLKYSWDLEDVELPSWYLLVKTVILKISNFLPLFVFFYMPLTISGPWVVDPVFW